VELAEMQKTPNFKFCWISDNPGIESDPKFYREGDEKTQSFKERITVKCAARCQGELNIIKK